MSFLYGIYMNKIRLKVPATSANVGSGFDCAGIAFELYNEFEFEKIENGFEILGCEERFANKDNLAYVAYRKMCEKIGADPSIRITILGVNVPNARGLGSSSTFICAGAYSALMLNAPQGKEQEFVKEHWELLCELCTEIEGHPDNVIPALYGSLCITVWENGRTISYIYEISDKIHFTVLIPSFEVRTADARAVLPKTVSREDAVYNMSRLALMPHAFINGNFDLLKVVTKDKIHEQYRKKLFRNIDEIEKIAYDLGASSFVISGAGSTCLCMSENSIADKLNEQIKDLENTWVAKELKVAKNGIVVC